MTYGVAKITAVKGSSDSRLRVQITGAENVFPGDWRLLQFLYLVKKIFDGFLKIKELSVFVPGHKQINNP